MFFKKPSLTMSAGEEQAGVACEHKSELKSQTSKEATKDEKEDQEQIVTIF